MPDWWFIMPNKILFECLPPSSYFLAFFLCPLWITSRTTCMQPVCNLYATCMQPACSKNFVKKVPCSLLHHNLKTWNFIYTSLLSLLPFVLVVSAWCKSAVHDTRLAGKTKSIICCFFSKEGAWCLSGWYHLKSWRSHGVL